MHDDEPDEDAPSLRREQVTDEMIAAVIEAEAEMIAALERDHGLDRASLDGHAGDVLVAGHWFTRAEAMAACDREQRRLASG